MGDYIEREAAILGLLEKGQHSRRYKLGDVWELNFDEIREAIAGIPAADVRPVVRGEWEWEMYQYTPHCSICGGTGFPGPANGKRHRFCPSCGADMRPQEGAE